MDQADNFLTYQSKGYQPMAAANAPQEKGDMPLKGYFFILFFLLFFASLDFLIWV